MNSLLENSILTDNELVALSLSEQDYFGILIERYQNKLLRYVNRITNVSHEDAQDILQNIFIKAYINLHGFDRKLSFNSWIYRIAHNEVVDWSRKSKTKQKYGQIDYDDEVFDWTEDGQHFLKEFYAEEDRQELQRVLQQLPVKYREVLVLKFIEGYSYSEMSDILKKPEGTIGTLMNRAKKKLRELYENTEK